MNDTQGYKVITGFMIGFISAEKTGLCRSIRGVLSPNFINVDLKRVG